MNKRLVFHGSATAMVTPFTEDGVNLPALARRIEFQIAGGTAALVVLGTTGEPSTMSGEEKEQAIRQTVERAAGRVPVIAGAGSNDTAATVRNCKRFAELGADALLLVTPYYNKTTQAGLIAHFTAAADATDLPVILYNVPARTGLNLLPDTLEVLSRHPNIVAVKEACGNIDQVTAVASIPDLFLYSGEDSLTLPILALGGRGVISVISNVVPRLMADLCSAWEKGDTAEALRLQLKLYPLCKSSMCEVNPIPVKTAMNLLGMEAGPLRLPLVPMQSAGLAQLKRSLQGLGLLP